MTTSTSRYLTVHEVANDMSVSEQLIWKLIRQNKFPAKIIRLGGAIRIERASWETFLAINNEPVAKRGRPPKPTYQINMDFIRNMSL